MQKKPTKAMQPPAGYSGKPLAEKLGIKPGMQIYARNPPEYYREILGRLPAGAAIVARRSGELAFVHLFVTDAATLHNELRTYRHKITQNGMIWVSWPKKASKVSTDVTEDVVRELALPLGLVDVRVCAVDETWSGLKLVIRREERRG